MDCGFLLTKHIKGHIKGTLRTARARERPMVAVRDGEMVRGD